MRKYFRWTAVLLPIFILITACKKTLDLKPTDQIIADEAIKFVPDLERAVVGVYGAMGNTSIANRSVGNADIIISSLMSDENYLPAENASANGVNMYRWLITPDEPYSWANWGSSVTGTYTGSNYAVIDRANRVLRVIDGIPANTTEEEGRKIRLKGELLAIRAFCHFRVLKSYAENYEPSSLGIPYMKTVSNVPGEVKPFRLTVEQSFEKIQEDLLEAKSLLANIPFTDVTRINSVAATALQARIFLYQKKWQQAIDAATEVIKIVPLATAGQFPGIWSDANTAEVLWKLKKDSDNDRIGQFYRTTAGVVEYAASPKLYNSFEPTDVRLRAYISFGNRGNNKTSYQVNKYAYNTTTSGLADIKLLRVAEMYLIRAEAYGEMLDGNPANMQLALNDLNTLRNARIAGTPVFVTTKQELIDAVYTERFKELAFEGHRYFDLRRRSLPINRLPLAPDDAGGIDKVELKPTEKAYYLPIPGFEMRANENMVQNPIYNQ